VKVLEFDSSAFYVNVLDFDFLAFYVNVLEFDSLAFYVNVLEFDSLIDNTTKCANIYTCNFVYRPLILRTVSVFFRSSSGSFNLPSFDNTQIEYEMDYPKD
jgi:hypothetical protein